MNLATTCTESLATVGEAMIIKLKKQVGMVGPKDK